MFSAFLNSTLLMSDNSGDHVIVVTIDFTVTKYICNGVGVTFVKAAVGVVSAVVVEAAVGIIAHKVK